MPGSPVTPWSRGGADGATLIELLVGLALAGLVVLALYSLTISQNRIYGVEHDIVALQRTARVAMEQMVREIRMAGYDPLERNLRGIQEAGATRLTVAADLDRNGNLGGPREVVTYFLDGPNRRLRRTTTSGGTQTLAGGIEGLDFTYLYADGSSSAEIGLPVIDPPSAPNFVDSVRVVIITLVARTSGKDVYWRGGDNPLTPGSEGDGYHRTTLTSSVALRNLAF